jgi:hypothetical protein
LSEVAEPSEALPRIRNLGDAVESVVSKLGLQASGVRETRQARDRIIHAMCRVPEWISGGDQVAVYVVRKRRRGFCGNGSLHTGRLAKAIVRNGRHVRERVFDRQQIPVRIVEGEFGDLVQT